MYESVDNMNYNNNADSASITRITYSKFVYVDMPMRIQLASFRWLDGWLAGSSSLAGSIQLVGYMQEPKAMKAIVHAYSVLYCIVSVPL